ncbi:hypothetical protein BSL78_16449 [Apostichopus japonicus]|uniref:Sushi domain-containing protein n=1 Tax=Stichopus japonicus TaxID=307972 RepID=A0A2G8KF79_STIJA|nr:hypothetical protein BSL78_16449 [Apostichopus japonicus]
MASLCDFVQVLTVFFCAIDLVTAQTTPVCSSNECERPLNQAGLTFGTDKPCYSDNDVITYTCQGTFFGPSENICNGSSGWIYSQPVCKETESLSVPQTSRPTTTFAITSATSSSIATGVKSLSPSTKSNTGSSIEPYSTKPSTEPTERRTEPPASSLKPTEANWNGLIIGLCVGVGGGILIVVASLVGFNLYWKNYKNPMVGPDDNYELNQQDMRVKDRSHLAITNKSFSETLQQ